jgi:hypothetical protein
MLLMGSCFAESSLSFKKEIAESSWTENWGPALPYHVRVVSKDFWYEIKWDGKVIYIKSSVERDYASWTDEQWKELINWCYVSSNDLIIVKL